MSQFPVSIGQRVYLARDTDSGIKRGYAEVVKFFEAGEKMERADALIWYGFSEGPRVSNVVARTRRIGLVREPNGNLIIIPEPRWHLIRKDDSQEKLNAPA